MQFCEIVPSTVYSHNGLLHQNVSRSCIYLVVFKMTEGTLSMFRMKRLYDSVLEK